jgi:hypothetical protein
LSRSRSTGVEIPATLPLSAYCHNSQLLQALGMFGQLTFQFAIQSGQPPKADEPTIVFQPFGLV